MKVGFQYDSPVLFPGYKLDRRVVTHRETHRLIGCVCEALAEAVVGGTRTVPTSAADVCPDIVDAKNGILYEVKGGRKDVKLCSFQLDDYARVEEDGWRVFYVWVWHDATDIRTRTVRDFVEVVASNTYAVDVYPLKVVEAIVASEERGTWTCSDWKRLGGDPRPQPPLHMVSRAFARRIRAGLREPKILDDNPARHVVGALDIPRVGTDAVLGHRLSFDGETFWTGGLLTSWALEEVGVPPGAGVRELIHGGEKPTISPF